MYLGLDLGTSGLRALLVSENGDVLAEEEAKYGTQTPHPGWSEQDPQDWVTACETVMGNLRQAYPDKVAALRGIGLSGQMHGATLLDADHNVLRPAMLWNDTRAAQEAQRLDQAPHMREITGNIVFPGFTAPKLDWVRSNEPELFDKVALVLLPKDYLRLWLTGEAISDMSDSAGTAWFDTGARDWSDAALAEGHMRRDQMPALVEGAAPGGQLRGDLRAAWGISGPVVLAGGGGDNAAAACGAGCFAEGSGFVSLGTSGVLLAARSSYAPAPATAVHSFCHAVPERWYQMGVILAATDCLNWLSRVTGQPPAALAGTLPAQIAGPSTLTFLPYLSGERTPHNDPAIRGSFVGLDISHDQAELTQAVMEGVAFALRDSLDALSVTGARLETLLAIGGGAQSEFWLDTLASVLNLPLDLPEGGAFGAALGAARLAICAVTGAQPEDVMTAPPIARQILPRADLTDAYAAAHDRYRALYPAIRGAFQ
ncbi:xylulokinase [Aliishimia ponticola]|uniref:Xylulose kinase n=1 Tax=Aliishimia ponticola TaxID=2499833 RepID=A0A4S4NIM9_9RHOB|nr:xylulokinase [Aliishimia ponticola]THH38587.1 xylulokinase [Aliishimia ponticola]